MKPERTFGLKIAVRVEGLLRFLSLGGGATGDEDRSGRRAEEPER